MNLSLKRLPTSSWRCKHLIAVLALGWVLAGCTRTVHWEEEVLLNTGETIWVKRSGTYTYRSASGNPLDYGYQPDWVSTIEFFYRRKNYLFTNSAGLILLAVAPDGTPKLVASAANHDWQWENKYYCVTPFYVQFNPNSMDHAWKWPDAISEWLFNLPTNLLFGVPPIAASGKKISIAEKGQLNASVFHSFKHYRSIEPGHTTTNCPRKG